MLGHDSVEAYVQWIRNETHWGGEPEVLMLAEHFETELVIVSCESLSLLRYAEGGKNGTAYLLYTGQHYDPLPNAAMPSDAPCRAFAAGGGGSGGGTASVVVRDKAAIALAQQHNLDAARRAKERRVQRLKCSGCDALCDDAAAFQAHCGEVEHGEDFAYDCEQVEVVVGADEALPEGNVDLNAPEVFAFYNASAADTLSFSMRYGGAPFDLGGQTFPTLEAYWRSPAIAEACNLSSRGVQPKLAEACNLSSRGVQP